MIPKAGSNIVKMSVCRCKKARRLFSIALLSIPFALTAQNNITFRSESHGMQYGFSFKGIVEFGGSKKMPGANPYFRVSMNAGIASEFLADYIYPAVNFEAQLYNGGIGSKSEKRFLSSPLDLDIVAAMTMTIGTDNHFQDPKRPSLYERDIPMYYFADFVYPALQNPFDYSLSVGTNLVFTPLNCEKRDQRVGFLNFHFNPVQISYYNDGGTIIREAWLGDRKDRNYTGGAVISYHGRPYTALSLIELSYQKYTGYTKNAFEVSNLLFLNYMEYKDPEQRNYNKSLYSLNFGNGKTGNAFKLSYYNSVTLDAQHTIHWLIDNTYHMVPYDKHFDFSYSHYATYTKIGLR